MSAFPTFTIPGKFLSASVIEIRIESLWETLLGGYYQ